MSDGASTRTDEIASAATSMPARELWMLLTLMLVQFTGIMDMIIVAPLELPLARAFHRDAAWFAATILAFTISSCVCNLLLASFIDRFDRKRVLLLTFMGFGLGQLACVAATSPGTYVGARVFAGAFAGIMSAAATAIVGDAVPPARRGTASGIMNAAFALAFIVGVPLGLWLSGRFSWRAPFALMASQVAVVSVMAALLVPPVRGHLEARTSREAGARAAVLRIVTDGVQLRSLLLNGALMFSNYAVTPFIAGYMVANLGFAERSIPLFYLLGGLFTLVVVVAIGVYADKRGHAGAFIAITVPSALAALWISVLSTRSLAFAIFVTTVYMATMTGRTVPALSMALASVPDELRGGFMNLNSAAQQLSLGLGAVAGGAILIEQNHVLSRFGWCGALSAAVSMLCVLLAVQLRARVASLR